MLEKLASVQIKLLPIVKLISEEFGDSTIK
jgi:hypothetical protein